METIAKHLKIQRFWRLLESPLLTSVIGESAFDFYGAPRQSAAHRAQNHGARRGPTRGNFLSEELLTQTQRSGVMRNLSTSVISSEPDEDGSSVRVGPVVRRDARALTHFVTDVR